MGAFKQMLIDAEEILLDDMPDLDPEPDNRFEEALAHAEIIAGPQNEFYRGCARFYSERGYLTDRQVEALESVRRRYPGGR